MLKLGRFWTAANVFSLCRPLVALPAAILIYTDGPRRWILLLILIAALTDWLDGQWARRTRTVSEWGKVLDPVCDKVAIVLVGAAMVLSQLVPLWFVGVILIRDLLIVAGSLVLVRRVREVHMSNWAGKAAVSAIAITFLLGLLGPDRAVLQFCIWSSVALMTLSLGLYAFRFFHLQQELSRDNALDGTL